MQIFISCIVLVILFALLWLVQRLNITNHQIERLGTKFDNLIVLLERIEHNTENASKYLCEESQAYQTWKDELEDEREKEHA